MGKLYGYKRWYEIEQNNGKKGSFKRKIRVKRVYDEESKSYVVRHDEVEDTELIKNKNFIILKPSFIFFIFEKICNIRFCYSKFYSIRWFII